MFWLRRKRLCGSWRALTAARRACFAGPYARATTSGGSSSPVKLGLEVPRQWGRIASWNSRDQAMCSSLSLSSSQIARSASMYRAERSAKAVASSSNRATAPQLEEQGLRAAGAHPGAVLDDGVDAGSVCAIRSSLLQ